MATPAGKLFLLDGMALAYRAHFAMIRSPRLTSAGLNTSAIFGYVNTVLEILDQREPTHLAVAFDTPEPTFRHRLFPAYKATRDAMPEDLATALPHVLEVTAALRIPVLRCPGYEADDIIGTLAKRAAAEGLTTYMVTPDKDFGQLVAEGVYQYKPAREGALVLGVPEICQQWGISHVGQLLDILGLMGDASDNVPGVPGVGEKTAQKLIAEFGSLENLLANLDRLKGKQKENLAAHAADARLSKRLVTIDTAVPVAAALADLRVQPPDRERLRALFAQLEFRNLGKRLLGEEFDFAPVAAGAGAPPSPPAADAAGVGDADADADADAAGEAAGEAAGDAAPAVDLGSLATSKTVAHEYHLADTPARQQELLNCLRQRDAFCFDIETTGRDARAAEIVGLGFAWEPHRAWYVPFPAERVGGLALLETFRPLFEDPQVLKIGQNLKFDFTVLRWHGLRPAGPVFDTMLAHYLVAPDQRHTLEFMAQVCLRYNPIPLTALIGPPGDGQRSPKDVPVADLAEYCAEDADCTLQLKELLTPRLTECGAERAFALECRLVPVLVEMEHEGVRLDPAPLAEFAKQLEHELTLTEKAIYQQAGTPFNLNSPKQIGQVLFDLLKLEAAPKKTRTGQYATNEQTLQRLAARHAIVRDLLEFREMQKLKTTYVDMLPAAIDPRTGRIHTTFSQAVTATGRLASEHPNLQNIPIRTARGREIRRAFVPAGPAYRLLSADYSQIELRIIAEFSRDPALLAAFQSGEDIHRATAALVYHVAPGLVTSEMRTKSKMVNYGIAYGMSAFGLAQRLNIARTEAAAIIDAYFAAFPGIKRYMDETVAFARQHGYVETLLGRRRYLRDINSRNAASRNAAERNAINSPIQGTAADMIKIAMVNLHQSLRERRLQTRLLLQIHDELLFDLHRDEEATVVPLVRDAMVGALPMRVPIEVEIGVGDDWLAAH